MKMLKQNEIIIQLKEFRSRLSNNPGHKHLYDFFDKILLALSRKEELKRDEVCEIEYTIDDLIRECKHYWHFKNYSIKCYICAKKLNSLIKDSKVNIEERLEGTFNPNDFICIDFLTYDDKNSIWIPSNKTMNYIEKLKENEDKEEIRKIIIILFQETDKGRRPWDVIVEYNLRELTKIGINLLKYYISVSHNLSLFVKLKAYVNVLALQSSYDHIFKTLETTKDERAQRKYNNQAQVLAEIIELQLDFYLLWVENDTKSFLSELNFEFITELLELFDDTKFEVFFKKIASIKNDYSSKIVNFYLNDNEIEIRNLAKGGAIE
jgi:hypothetical protein